MPQDAAPLLQVRDLAVDFRTMDGSVRAIEHVEFDLAAGETLAIVGESGSGKSTTAMAVIGLLAGNGRVAEGSILLDGRQLVGASESVMRGIRGKTIGLVPQDPMSNLNPVSKIGTQIAETLLAHGMATRANVAQKVVETLAAAGLPDAEKRAKQYPHEFSGGMRQRALIAIGLACNPRLLIADEPTSALDVTVQKTILDQLGRMTADLGTALMLITHDLGLAAERASRVIVMHRGRIVEQGPARQILEDPQAEYTKALVAAAPSVAAVRLRPQVFRRPDATGAQPAAGSDAAGTGTGPAPIPTARAATTTPRTGAAGAADAGAASAVDNILEVEGLTKVFPVRGSKEDFTAVKDVSFAIPRGETVAVVGESGSGKTTTARMVLKVVEATSGSIRFDGQDVASLKGRELRTFRQRVQPIFQDPYSSLNPMFTIERIIEEPLSFYKRGSAKQRSARVRKLMDDVALPQSMLRRYPAELSGGQRQRVAIARALALSPDLIVCDEPVSALDVLVQAQILTLLGDLQREYGQSYLFISHDLAVVRLISDYVCVMKDGVLVEAATSEEIFTNARDPYTRKLLASIPGNELDIAV
ncbi:ABC transporter ATP-binding protein [Microbacterium sp. zg.Y1090]|uniref:dipeptide ABC transporter ATP-binding protein n=1 Tax=Microbacterium TaxID=33882 RepID=UPI00214C706F|nr:MULTISPECIES: ABC transporter ATP-binding protein [unclassified Microbacterium]MCR2813758.1 ABC transporter ATP-binding protein [Microbacterium sp. zg.Y1084]MCR2819728.1 ABC transporter ATP-binding protein [Microbacterium sp. zg.Y1090]MDL5487576.1 ABC transporter ATP-binding protein [Microbacterium sp. zg-Y1211]WIM28032.1 ABC transporter ATP-binding protein [Microbacterium sp. zg-Y1090]